MSSISRNTPPTPPTDNRIAHNQVPEENGDDSSKTGVVNALENVWRTLGDSFDKVGDKFTTDPKRNQLKSPEQKPSQKPPVIESGTVTTRQGLLQLKAKVLESDHGTLKVETLQRLPPGETKAPAREVPADDCYDSAAAWLYTPNKVNDLYPKTVKIFKNPEKDTKVIQRWRGDQNYGQLDSLRIERGNDAIEVPRSVLNNIPTQKAIGQFGEANTRFEKHVNEQKQSYLSVHYINRNGRPSNFTFTPAGNVVKTAELPGIDPKVAAQISVDAQVNGASLGSEITFESRPTQTQIGHKLKQEKVVIARGETGSRVYNEQGVHMYTVSNKGKEVPPRVEVTFTPEGRKLYDYDAATKPTLPGQGPKTPAHTVITIDGTVFGANKNYPNNLSVRVNKELLDKNVNNEGKLTILDLSPEKTKNNPELLRIDHQVTGESIETFYQTPLGTDAKGFSEVRGRKVVAGDSELKQHLEQISNIKNPQQRLDAFDKVLDAQGQKVWDQKVKAYKQTYGEDAWNTAKQMVAGMAQDAVIGAIPVLGQVWEGVQVGQQGAKVTGELLQAAYHFHLVQEARAAVKKGEGNLVQEMTTGVGAKVIAQEKRLGAMEEVASLVVTKAAVAGGRGVAKKGNNLLTKVRAKVAPGSVGNRTDIRNPLDALIEERELRPRGLVTGEDVEVHHKNPEPPVGEKKPPAKPPITNKTSAESALPPTENIYGDDLGLVKGDEYEFSNVDPTEPKSPVDPSKDPPPSEGDPSTTDGVEEALDTSIDAELIAQATELRASMENPPTTDPSPVEGTPVVETPVVETPVVETPVVETPVVETPVDGTQRESTPVLSETAPVPPRDFVREMPWVGRYRADMATLNENMRRLWPGETLKVSTRQGEVFLVKREDKGFSIENRTKSNIGLLSSFQNGSLDPRELQPGQRAFLRENDVVAVNLKTADAKLLVRQELAKPPKITAVDLSNYKDLQRTPELERGLNAMKNGDVFTVSMDGGDAQIMRTPEGFLMRNMRGDNLKYLGSDWRLQALKQGEEVKLASATQIPRRVRLSGDGNASSRTRALNQEMERMQEGDVAVYSLNGYQVQIIRTPDGFQVRNAGKGTVARLGGWSPREVGRDQQIPLRPNDSIAVYPKGKLPDRESIIFTDINVPAVPK